MLEYLAGGSLDSWLLRCGNDATVSQLEFMLMQVASGMHELCGNLGLIHRDLAARNVLVGFQLHVKVIDIIVMYSMDVWLLSVTCRY